MEPRNFRVICPTCGKATYFMLDFKNNPNGTLIKLPYESCTHFYNFSSAPIKSGGIKTQFLAEIEAEEVEIEFKVKGKVGNKITK
jgi:hypothetical protein